MKIRSIETPEQKPKPDNSLARRKLQVLWEGSWYGWVTKDRIDF